MSKQFDRDIPEHFRGDLSIAAYTRGKDRPDFVGIDGVNNANGRDIKYACEQEIGGTVNIRAVVRGISEEAFTAINIILINTHLEDVISRTAILSLLRFHIQAGISDEIRETLTALVPYILDEMNHNPLRPARLMKLFQLYEIFGDNPEIFEEQADLLVANMKPGERAEMLVHFHVIMRRDLPVLVRELSKGE